MGHFLRLKATEYIKKVIIVNSQKFTRNLWITLILLIFLILPIEGRATKKSVVINWTDTGVYGFDRPECLNRPDDFLFGSLPPGTLDIFPEISPKGKILIPMPTNEMLPKTEQEWQAYTNKLAAGIKSRLEQALVQGIEVCEIRTVQNITIKSGYWDKDQQNRCVRFTQAFLDALAQVKRDLAVNYNITVNGMVGSNGGHVASSTIPYLKINPVDKLIIIDGRAYEQDVIKTFLTLKGNLIIINTGGDAYATATMVANHECAKGLKALLPNLIVIYVDPKGWNLPHNIVKAHISAMNPGTELVMKVLLKDGYSPSQKVTGMELRKYLNLYFGEPTKPFTDIPHYWTNGGRKESMTEAETMIAFAREKKKALVVGEGREAEHLYKRLVAMLGGDNVKWVKDPANWIKNASEFGAEVVLGVKKVAPPERKFKGLKDDERKKATLPPPPPPPPPGGGGAAIVKPHSAEFQKPPPEPPDEGGGESVNYTGRKYSARDEDAIVGISEDGRPYIIITVDGKRIVIWIPKDLYNKIKGKLIKIRSINVGNITIIIIIADGEPVWEIHIGPGGRIIHQGPPTTKVDKIAKSPNVAEKAKGVIMPTEVVIGVPPDTRELFGGEDRSK